MKLSELVDAVSETDETILITKNGRPAAVLVSPKEFDSWEETMAIRDDGDFINEIREGLQALKEQQANLYTLDELFEEAE